MQSNSYNSGASPEHHDRDRKFGGRNNWTVAIFIVASLLISMSVTQEEAPEPGSLRYWLLILPAVVFPFFDIKAIVRVFLGRAWWLSAFLVIAGSWHLILGDVRASIQLALLIWVTAWFSSNPVSVKSEHLSRIYLFFVVLGIVVYVGTDLNRWGLLPGMTVDEYGLWRVSFFPNIAYTAFLSLVVIMVLTRDISQAHQYAAILAVAVYFLVASFVRTALIALVLYSVMYWWFRFSPSPTRLFWGALAVGFGVNVLIALSPAALHFLQGFPVISRLFLRGETQLTFEEISQQLYRPWLWGEHFNQFMSSPWLLGLGAFEFDELKKTALIEGQEQGDSVSLPTRLIAAYGLAGLLFTGYLIARLRHFARVGDAWACACFAPVLLLTLHWGSIFHPSDALFGLFMMMILRGSTAYPIEVRAKRRSFLRSF